VQKIISEILWEEIEDYFKSVSLCLSKRENQGKRIPRMRNDGILRDISVRCQVLWEVWWETADAIKHNPLVGGVGTALKLQITYW